MRKCQGSCCQDLFHRATASSLSCGPLAPGIVLSLSPPLSAPQGCWPSPASRQLVIFILYLFYEAGKSNWAEPEYVKSSYVFYDLKGLFLCLLPVLLSLCSILAGPRAHFLGPLPMPLPPPSEPTDREMVPNLLVCHATGYIATRLAMSGHTVR